MTPKSISGRLILDMRNNNCVHYFTEEKKDNFDKRNKY